MINWIRGRNDGEKIIVSRNIGSSKTSTMADEQSNFTGQASRTSRSRGPLQQLPGVRTSGTRLPRASAGGRGQTQGQAQGRGQQQQQQQQQQTATPVARAQSPNKQAASPKAASPQGKARSPNGNNNQAQAGARSPARARSPDTEARQGKTKVSYRNAVTKRFVQRAEAVGANGQVKPGYEQIDSTIKVLRKNKDPHEGETLVYIDLEGAIASGNLIYQNEIASASGKPPAKFQPAYLVQTFVGKSGHPIARRSPASNQALQQVYVKSYRDADGKVVSADVYNSNKSAYTVTRTTRYVSQEKAAEYARNGQIFTDPNWQPKSRSPKPRARGVASVATAGNKFGDDDYYGTSAGYGNQYRYNPY
jgi:hypothetical protein